VKSAKNFLILIVTALVITFLLAYVRASGFRGEAADTVIGVLVLLIPLVVVLWLATVIKARFPRKAALRPEPARSEGSPVIRLGGAADRRFERRLTILRRTARYLLLADVIAVIFVVNLGSGKVADAVTGILVLLMVPLVLLSLVRIVTAKVTRDVTVRSDSERIFGLVVDPHRWIRYYSSWWLGQYRKIDAVEPASSGGTKGRATLRALGLPGHLKWEMLIFQPPRRVDIFARASWIGIPQLRLASWSLEPEDGGVKVHHEYEMRQLGLSVLSGRKVVTAMIRLVVDRGLAHLKAEAERSE
jgi:hypothetical protein